MQNKIPVSKTARGLEVGKAMLKIGVAQSKGVVKRAFMSEEKKQESKNETHAQIAKVIIESLGTLKGISVKVAQQLALGLPFMPKEYLDEISKSFNSIPPINKALVRKVIKQELGVYPNEAYGSFENESFGAASLGQVHRASKDGEKLAVKIQYPGIATSIDSDMGILRFAMNRIVKSGNTDHLIKEIEDRLQEEVDYELEADNTEYFYEHLKKEHIEIPKINRELSTKKVLTSSYLDGIDLQRYLDSNPSQEERNHYAQLIFDSFFISLYQLQVIHADPNPGNFIFMDDGKLGLIDFGCVKRLDDEFLDSFSKLHVMLLDEVDDMTIADQYSQMGMIDEPTSEEMLEFYVQVIKPLDRFYIEIFKEDKYDFVINSNFAERGFDIATEVHKKNRHAAHNMSEDYIFVDRTLLGYYAIFERMEAKIDTKFAKRLMRGIG